MLDDYKVSRKVGKASTLPTAPAYSFGARREKAPVDTGPGPGQYGTGWTMSTKGTGFGTSPRSPWQLNDTPAGAAYQPSLGQVAHSKPAYTFGGKSRKADPTPSPGPGAYDPAPAENLVKPSPNAHSIAQRPPGERESERSPGPAEYSPNFQPRDVHAASVKFRNRLNPRVEPTPGPGEYNTPRKQRPFSEGKTFGISRSERIRDTGAPGPGEYGVPPDPRRPRRASWTIGRASRDSGLRAGGPGPGAYEVIEPLIERDGGYSVASDHRSQPAYTFGGKPPWQPPQDGPGPSEYGIPHDPGRASKPVFTLHGANLRERKPDGPGPAAYHPGKADEVVRRSAPNISMALRAYEPGVKDIKPGPGVYDPKDGDGRIAVSLKFRWEVHPDNMANPAPHDYADKDFRGFGTANDGTAMKKGFTMRPRWREDQRERVPGPQYAVGCSTLGVAAFPMVDKSKMDAAMVL